MEWVLVAAAFVLGAIVGSFLNALIYRLPRGISLWNPSHSFCPKCKEQLSNADLVPIFSWMMLGGRCRYCNAKVSPRYAVIELVHALLWAAIGYRYGVLHWEWPQAIVYGLAVSALLAALAIDLELYIIPDQLNAFLLAAGLAYNVVLFQQQSDKAMLWGMPSSIAGAIVGTLTLFGIALFGRLAFRRDAMGHGDIKMARGIGAILLPATALMSFGMAVVLGAVLGIVQIAAGLRSQGQEPAEGETQEELPPESVKDLIWCGFGYLLWIDVFGLFIPKLYQRWFGVHPYAQEDVDSYGVEPTMIPFGPYLALGAIVAVVFEEALWKAFDAYARWAFGR